jgi:hypothetical protein
MDIEKQFLNAHAQEVYPLVNNDPIVKQGNKYCGCFCDTRRATIIFSIIFLTLSAINFVVLLGAESVKYATRAQIDDDILIDAIERSYIIGAILASIAVFTNIASLIGGIQYNANLVAVNVCWFIVQFMANLITDLRAFNEIVDNYRGTETLTFPWGSVLVSAAVIGFVIAPMIRFIKEVRSGIMSPETYPRENFSCCCTN